MAAGAASVCGVGVKSILALGDRSGRIVVFGSPRTGDSSLRARARGSSGRNSGRGNRRARSGRGRGSGNRHTRRFGCRFRAASATVPGAGAASGGIRRSPIGADRRDLGPCRARCDALRRLRLALYDLLLTGACLLVNASVSRASTPPRGHRSRSILADRRRSLRIERRRREQRNRTGNCSEHQFPGQDHWCLLFLMCER